MCVICMCVCMVRVRALGLDFLVCLLVFPPIRAHTPTHKHPHNPGHGQSVRTPSPVTRSCPCTRIPSQNRTLTHIPHTGLAINSYLPSCEEGPLPWFEPWRSHRCSWLGLRASPASETERVGSGESKGVGSIRSQFCDVNVD